MSESSWAERLRAGDGAAFDELAEQHGQRLHAVARNVVGCSETAAEVVQDVLFRLWRDRESLIIREHVAGYLARAVRNRALDQVKRQRVESRWREQELREVERDQVERVSRGAHDGVPAEAWDHAIHEALDQLPARRREAVLLRWRDGLSYDEIARRLQISVKTVENQIGRGLKALRATLGGAGGAQGAA
ncbi:MAG: RNA polymerase sigma-70 factor [Gemmatimonadota bacterium]